MRMSARSRFQRLGDMDVPVVLEVKESAMPEKSATQEKYSTAALRTGVIEGVSSEGGWVVATDLGRSRAQKAAGCLLDPEQGDVVLFADLGKGGLYIIQVLIREEKEGSRFVFPSGSTVTADGGGLGIEAGNLSLSGDSLVSHFKRVSTSAGVVDESAELMRERYGRHYEEVRDVRETRLGRLRCLVSGLLSLRGKRVDVKARKRLKLDGEGVEIG